jgi:hypothetical protein
MNSFVSHSKEVPITNHSILHVYFKDLSVLRFRRDVIYSWNDLLGKSLELSTYSDMDSPSVSNLFLDTRKPEINAHFPPHRKHKASPL